MKLSVETNWNICLLDALSEYPVAEYYGHMCEDPFGSGRPGAVGGSLNRVDAETHIQSILARGIVFNYRLDATCLGNRLDDPARKKEMKEHLSWLSGIGVKLVTVSSPYLVGFVKAHNPSLRVRVSVWGEIDGMAKARYFQEAGADELIVDPVRNRDFGFLRQLVKNTPCDVLLVANQACLFQCAFCVYHGNCQSHLNREAGSSDSPVGDYCVAKCLLERLRRPEQLLRARWIRPEDLGQYESVGYTRFVLSCGSRSTSWIKRAVAAYSQRNHDGNLLDILDIPTLRLSDERILDLSEQVRVDNGALHGFLERFADRACTSSCPECCVCSEIAERAVTCDVGVRQTLVEQVSRRLQAIL